MAYKVVSDFEDTQDNKYFYEAGKPYPREGYEPTEERIEELSKRHPKYKRIFIVEVPTEANENEESNEENLKESNEQEEDKKKIEEEPKKKPSPKK